MFTLLVSIIVDFPFCDTVYLCNWRETSGVCARNVADRTVTVTGYNSEKNIMELNTGTYNLIQVLVRCKIPALFWLFCQLTPEIDLKMYQYRFVTI
jgi:hypothetical protein